MSMTWVPNNHALWTPRNAMMLGFADPYDARKHAAREPDAMIMKIEGVYMCAVGPDWCAPFIDEVCDPWAAQTSCVVEYDRRIPRAVTRTRGVRVASGHD